MPRAHCSPHAALPADDTRTGADGPALADGPAREALRQALAQLDMAEQLQQPAALCQALADTAQALAKLRAFPAAEQCLARAQRWALALGAADLRADLACAAAELAAGAADLALTDTEDGCSLRRARDRARDQAFEAARLAGQTADPHWEIQVLLRASDVLDRCGDHDDAVQMQHRALVLMGLHERDTAPDTPATVAEPQYLGLRMAAPGQLM